ncbi:LysE/ArgO family amino acid transporter [Agromyces protaetiae]|uniref:LysE/ArgO family amino acid transporter n=1 Tax=Agromyces protaetiae TaxID=2509455 RepID=UPI001FB64499|nr:LysE/ArgO family amino acid transporter [Agromyces protaetiae]
MDVSSLAAGLGLGLSLIIAIGAQNVFVLRQGIRREHVFAVAAVCAASDLVLIAVGVSGIGAVLAAVPWLIDAVRWAGFAFLVGYGLLAARRALRPSHETLVVDAGAPAETSDHLVSHTPSNVIQEGIGASRRVGGDTPGHPAVLPESRDVGGSARDGGSGNGPTVATRATAVATRATLAATIATCLALTWLNPHVYLDTVFLLGSVANTHGDGRWWFALGAGVASIVWFFALAYGARFLGRWLASARAWRILDGCIAVVMIALGVSLVLPH